LFFDVSTFPLREKESWANEKEDRNKIDRKVKKYFIEESMLV